MFEKEDKMKKHLSPVLLVIAAAIWGFAFSAQKAAQTIAPFTLGCARSVFATVFLVFVIIAFDRIRGTGRRLFSSKKPVDLTRYEIIGGILSGTALTFATFFQQFGINAGTDAGKSAFITALYVVLVPIYALVLKKRAPLNVWISIAIAVVGFYFLCITDEFTMVRSDIFVLICALIFPIQILCIDKFSPLCDGIRMSLVQFITTSLLNLILALILESPIAIGEVIACILPILFLGIGSSGIAYTLQIVGQKGVNPAAASILMSLESVFGVVGSAILLGERMSAREYVGCAVVFVAVVISQIDFSIFSKKEQKVN